MSLKILTRDQIRKDNVGRAVDSHIFAGKMSANVIGSKENEIENSHRLITIKDDKKWAETEAHAKLWNEIEDLIKKSKSNVASFDSDSYYELIDKLRIDITRRRFDYPDLTGVIDMEQSNANYSKSVTLDEFLPFGAVFKEDNLRNGAVNLIDQKYGATGSVLMQGYSVGWKDTLENQLYNQDIFSLQKVLDAVSRGFVAKRNDLSAGEIVAKTFDASQKVPAATTTGASPEELLYETINKAVEVLTNLKDPQTGQLIRADRLALMCYPGDVRRINRAINGQLNNSKGTTANRQPLEVNTLIPYYGDTLYVGKDKITYPGVAKDKAYLFVPGEASWTLNKRGLTQETGRGSVLNLSTEEFAWYFIQTSYRKEFFGSSDADVKAKVGADHGYIVEVTLPTT
jgi:hypothetical protein